jgi:hypothetical protein
VAVICDKSLSKTQGDYYPRGMRRMTIDKRSLEAAAAFANDRADVPLASESNVPLARPTSAIPN